MILPEFVPRRLWQHLLHNQHALLIKGALLFRPNVVVTSVPFHLGRESPTEMSRVTNRPPVWQLTSSAHTGASHEATIGAASPFEQPAGVSGCPPRVHALIVLVRVTAALVTIAAVWVIARVMYAMPWPADALLAAMTASAWCRWLETRDPL